MQGDMPTLCAKPVVTCLSCCQVLPQPVEVAAAHTHMHIIRNTLIYLQAVITLPANELGASEAQQWQSPGLPVLLKAISCLSLA